MSPVLIGGLAVVGLALAALPAALTLANLRAFRPAPSPGGERRRVSVLVPARNEERAIGRLCRDVLASEGVDLELVVLDDSSDDRTAAIVGDIAAVVGCAWSPAGRSLPAGAASSTPAGSWRRRPGTTPGCFSTSTCRPPPPRSRGASPSSTPRGRRS
ncbi:MAG: glycosyltransferase family 2 protein [Planctomycetaceae bacterium]